MVSVQRRPPPAGDGPTRSKQESVKPDSAQTQAQAPAPEQRSGVPKQKSTVPELPGKTSASGIPSGNDRQVGVNTTSVPAPALQGHASSAHCPLPVGISSTSSLTDTPPLRPSPPPPSISQASSAGTASRSPSPTERANRDGNTALWLEHQTSLDGPPFLPAVPPPTSPTRKSSP
ncbi:uncharacterized protein THITE_2112823 [Thermothielavioides terrestris NRRL 8126]|uniref:Uncharacterized protein n=1 Tax=Thermothielavioides terrestris (strain ATCC 38088 / NRRL 8126) TaxID=578455 RepID=G2R0V7_THETT|nr:uncharacterized protein THITE_2112823 [Thermothielavioides terrestris NRRL 8126]AEO65651.1 hypothetical protein THITE_2112823 [Thermothielavioides terrestris NRRL 8126]